MPGTFSLRSLKPGGDTFERLISGAPSFVSHLPLTPFVLSHWFIIVLADHMITVLLCCYIVIVNFERLSKDFSSWSAVLHCSKNAPDVIKSIEKAYKMQASTADHTQKF